jgi:ubiquinone biosynthesis protein UbiJ
MDTLLAALLNRLLADQPGAAARLANHAGKRLRFTLPLARIDLAIDGEGRLLAAGAAAAVDCEIRIPPEVLLAWPLLGGEALAGVRVTGDGVLAGDLSALLRQLDRAVALAPYLGPVAAARVDAALDGLARWHGEAREAVAQSLAEYLVHEARLLVEAEAVREFVREVDELREWADRLAARVSRLEHPDGRP